MILDMRTFFIFSRPQSKGQRVSGNGYPLRFSLASLSPWDAPSASVAAASADQAPNLRRQRLFVTDRPTPAAHFVGQGEVSPVAQLMGSDGRSH